MLVIAGVLGLIAAGGRWPALHFTTIYSLSSRPVVLSRRWSPASSSATPNSALIHKRISAAVRAVAREECQAAVGNGDSTSGTADWDHVWEDLTGVAERLNFQTICLDVNAPAMHENYHARWDQAGGPSEAFLWRLEIPLFIKGIPIGRLSVSAERDEQSLPDALMVLVKIVEVAEIRATELTSVSDPTKPSMVPMAPSPVAPEPIIPARA